MNDVDIYCRYILDEANKSHYYDFENKNVTFDDNNDTCSFATTRKMARHHAIICD